MDAPVPNTDQVRNHYNGLFNGTGYILVEKNGMTQQVSYLADRGLL